MTLRFCPTYNSFHFILANLVIDLSVVQSKANVGGEMLNDLSILLVEVEVFHLVDKLKNSQYLSSYYDRDTVQGLGGVASLREELWYGGQLFHMIYYLLVYSRVKILRLVDIFQVDSVS